MRALAVALAIALAPMGALAATPVSKADPAILGTIPAYPGATRPLRQLESKERAIALTKDKPEVVAAYYIHGLVAAGWTPAPEVPQELSSAKAGQPAWLTFTRANGGRVDIQITAGRHPQTGQPVTLITYQSRFKP